MLWVQRSISKIKGKTIEFKGGNEDSFDVIQKHGNYVAQGSRITESEVFLCVIYI